MTSLSTPDPEYFETSDGVRIAYRWWGEGDGIPTVLHHGFASDSLTEWKAPLILEALLASGHHVLTLDARGHGRSDTPHDVGAYGLDRLVSDLSELLEALIPGRAIDLVGYSMGAIVVLRAAVVLGQRVRRLVVGGVGSGVVEVGGVDTRVIELTALVSAFGTDDVSSIEDPGLAAWRAQSDAAGADHWALSAVAASLLPAAIPLQEISAPALVITGADDPFADRPEILAAALSGARLMIVSGDHGGARSDPRFAASIVDFLAVSPKNEPRDHR